MNSNQTERGLWEWKLVKVILTASILFFTYNFLRFGYTEKAVRQCIAWSARIDVVLFMLAFGATAMHRYFRNSLSFWVMMNRPFFGISFAIWMFKTLTNDLGEFPISGN